MLLVISGDMLFAAQGVFVRVEKATAGDISQALEYTGQVQPLQVVEIRPEVSAKIAKIHFNEGAYVNAGQLLFTLDSSQYSATLASRKADLQSAETSLDSAKKYLQRLKAADKRSVPAYDMDNADRDVKQAQANVAKAKAQL